jgi:predicted 2-oxoglutarate/Fe(II)-dependent dioxygenase YbiX
MSDDGHSGGRPLRFGEALPLVHANSNRNPRFALGSLGGRYLLVCAIGDVTHAAAQEALAAIPLEPSDERERVCAIFHSGAQDERLVALSQNRLVFNDALAARQCGLIAPEAPEGRWLLLDPSLRVLAIWPLGEYRAALETLAKTPSPDLYAGGRIHAPVLIAPRVFEPAFCKGLIEYYEQHGGDASGVTQVNEAGKTFVSLDNAFKRRSDCLIADARLREAIMQRIYWRLAPQIEKAFMWRPTRMERYLIARYDAESGGFFKPHRDNTTEGTAHRRFAVTINLNASDYEGGDLRFPEFGAQTYRAPTGGAVVFSCALLHEATPVTSGARYAFLPFLYDDAAAKIREENNKYLDESIRPYADL